MHTQIRKQNKAKQNNLSHLIKQIISDITLFFMFNNYQIIQCLHFSKLYTNNNCGITSIQEKQICQHRLIIIIGNNFSNSSYFCIVIIQKHDQNN